MRGDLNTRFWAKVRKGPGCWEWTAAKLPHGYGLIGHGRGPGMDRAHRVAWELKHGPIPDGLCVLHRCDNPSCTKTEPDDRFPDGHLFLGTQLDNVRDMVAKGRRPSFKGGRNGRAKLTEDDVRAIRSLYPGATQAALASRFGVSGMAIRFILSRRNWPHVE